MANFQGFPSGKTHLTPIPAAFFSELLPQINDLHELKVILYTIWFLDQQEGKKRCITLRDYQMDQTLMNCFGKNAQNELLDALEKAEQHNVLIKAKNNEAEENPIYLLNSPRGRAAAKAIKLGSWQPDPQSFTSISLQIEKPNIFRLYEENIGPLTPIIADVLREAEGTYKPEWIEKAIKIAVEKNVRNWRYVEAILKSWLEEGAYEKDRRNPEEDRRKYLDGDYDDIIQH